MMQKLRPKAILFDLGSTLIEYEAVPWDELGRTCVKAGWEELKRLGLPLPDENEFAETYDSLRDEYRQRAANDLIEWSVPQVAAELFKRLGIDHHNGLTDRFFEAYYAPVARKLYLLEGVRETLALLRKHVEVIGLISNTIFPSRTHLSELRRFGINSFFDFTIFSSAFGWRKPHPAIFEAAVKKAGCTSAEAVYIGDRYREDIEGPSGIGMAAVLRVKPGRDYPAKMPLARRRIDRLAQLVDHIEISMD